MNRGRGRPKRCRAVAGLPGTTRFGPAHAGAGDPEILILTLDEYEALRLADHEGLYQEQAARRMDVSRATFGRILESARHTLARALVEGLVLHIEGGNIMTATQHMGRGGNCICPACDLRVPHQAGKPCAEERCPQCGKRLFREGGEHHRLYIEKHKGTKQ
ncbi:MAG: DUF134 domain-containing protein [Bacteroidetes bacterium]|nr:DUF134 domain-containing protein [Bacteroidota bacterium]